MVAGRALLLLIPTLLCAGCSDPRRQAEKTVKRVTAKQLRKEVALYYKNIFAEHRKTIFTVSPQYWSSSFNELHPERITAYPDGFAFCLEIRGDAESGLYIVPQGMEHDPKPTPWASYEKLSEGIFWYSFKP
jgi:hypothetical protein